MRIRFSYYCGSGRSMPPATGASMTSHALLGALLAAGATSALAQPLSDAPGLEEVVVTGSRVARSGYDTQTPVTVISGEEIEAAAPHNIADFVNQLPALVGSATPATSNASISSGTSGINAMNLRGLGSERTLVLLDGRRSVGSTIGGTVDINTFPQGLIESVEIVTGGASSAYGSDAVSGVVNYIMDKDFTGIKSTVDGGETTYGDDPGWRTDFTAGTPLMDGRGHFLFNATVARRDGIFGVPRDWNDDGWYIVNNPAYEPGNGQPERLLTNQAGPSEMTPGGIITDTALRGTYFGVNGTVNQLAYGSTQDPWMVGGDWRVTQHNDTQSLHQQMEREGAFTRFSYEISDSMELFTELSRSEYGSVGWGGAQRNNGNVVIMTDNAFLPAEVAQQAAALGITEFRLGTSNGDLSGDVDSRRTDNERSVERYALGLNGAFGSRRGGWTWDAYVQRGVADTHEEVGTTNNERLAMATDAVLHPVTSEIVCRSSIADPDNGCVPFNRMGVAVNDAAAIQYVIGYPQREQRFEQDVAAVNFSTEVENPIVDDPIAVAVGAEYRREEVSGFVEEQYQSGWYTGNYGPSFGEYDVSEAYVETLIPLPKRFEFSGAVRATDYSTSGSVTTWKTGFTWDATEALRLRLTKSRDIRAPNLGELYESGRRRSNTLIDPFNDNESVQFLENTTGNPNLKPEDADSIGIGFVLSPVDVPGFGLSLDYYEIEITNAIGAVNAQEIMDRCFAGNQDFCAAITRGTTASGAPFITELRNSPFNLVSETARGADLEMTYAFDVGRGDLILRALVTRYLELKQANGIDAPEDSVGQNSGGSPPDYLYRLTAAYSADRLSFSVTGRGVSSGVYDNSYIQCMSACPASTSLNRTINDNNIGGAFYIDTTFAYTVMSGNLDSEVFFSIRNLLNRDPEIVAQGPSGGSHEPATNQSLYDFLGRLYRVGVRFQW